MENITLDELNTKIEKLELELNALKKLRADMGGDPADIYIKECRRLKHSGQPIEAIKYYRSRFGVGLREAKDAVDWL